jgi:hypothetical protein
MAEHDPLIARHEEESAKVSKREERAANLFDVRRIIGGLFCLYGLLLLILGLFFASDADISQGQGINVNLWVGIGMLIFGGLMLTWAITRPLGRELASTGPDETPQRQPRAGAPAPTGVDAAALSEEARRRASRGDRPGSRRAGE